jgi:single-strand DNA-binding protein
MNFDINTITVQGRVVRPVEVLKTTKEGKSYAFIHVCTNYDWKDKDTGEKKTRPTWHSIKVWGVDADNAAKYLKKGQQVRLEGYMVSDEAEKDGQTVYYYYPQAKRVVYGYEARGEKKEGVINVAASEGKAAGTVDIGAVMKQLSELQALVGQLTKTAVPPPPPEPARESIVGAFPDEGAPKAGAGM